MAVLARMALSAVDAALLGTSLALNYRDHDRVFHGAEALLTALDTELLANIQASGLQATLNTLPTTAVAISVPPVIRDDTGVEVLHYQVYPGDSSSAVTDLTGSASSGCAQLYHLVVQATGVRPGTQVRLGLQRHACCADSLACEAGDFDSLRRVWHRLE
tara:strand:- start:2084 stop:2563 length:480 start_codon:yes stop_codon:yes gene_type:complete